jgi:hypothetical protein
MKRALYLLIPLTFILVAIGPGCYTVLMHPSEEGGYHAQQTSDCTSCHTDYNDYPYGYYYSPYPSYWWDHSDYAYYYAYPWWWSYYDYPYADGNYEYGQNSGHGTKFDRREGPREPAPPPYSDDSRDKWNDDYQTPVVYPTPTYDPGTGPTTTTSRTQPDTGDTQTQPADANSTKVERTPRNNTKTDNNTTVDQSDSSRDRQSKDEPQETKTKKSRRGGGG